MLPAPLTKVDEGDRPEAGLCRHHCTGDKAGRRDTPTSGLSLSSFTNCARVMATNMVRKLICLHCTSLLVAKEVDS